MKKTEQENIELNESTDNKPPVKKKIIIASAVSILLVAVLVTIAVYSSRQSSNETEAVYKEETVQYGSLMVGITEEGTVAIGTSTQTLDIDISAYTGSDTSTTSGNQGGGFGGMMGQMMNTNTNTTDSTSDSDTRELTVKEVYASVGQEIAEGDPIALLDSDTVVSIENDLESDVTEAQNTYDQTVTEQTLNDQSAEQNHALYSQYGEYAQTEYDTTVSTLQDDVDSAQSDLDDANETLNEYQDELDEDNENLPVYKKALTNAEYSVSGIDKETEMYSWLTAEYARQDAQTLVDDTEDEIDELTEKIEDQKATIEKYKIAIEIANEAYEKGVIEAEGEKNTKLYDNQNASEYYSVSTAQNALTTEEAKDDLTNAQSKLEDFQKYIQNDELVASENGIISDIAITAGDDLYSDSDLLTVNDYDKVTVAVDVDEDDIDAAELGSTAKVSIDAFPDTIFDAEVTDIGDAEYDSSTGTTSYEVTVTLSGDLSELYDGMNADVTFVTKDSEDVLYIPNRAVTRDDGKSYVKVRNSNGKVVEQEITTGFSDGTDVEIKDGLAEGDTVLIESKVSEE